MPAEARGASTSFYVQSGAKLSFAYIGQDANSGKVFYEVSGKNSTLTVNSREGNADGTIWHSNTGASIGNYKYSGSDTSTLRIADGGKFVVQGHSRNPNYQLNSGLKVYKNGILQLAPTSANDARQAGGSAMVEASTVNFQQGGKLELDLSGLGAMSE